MKRTVMVMQANRVINSGDLSDVVNIDNPYPTPIVQLHTIAFAMYCDLLLQLLNTLLCVILGLDGSG
jgi:hypothetical protein